jgi:isopentenyl-diphosphate delta-isomerase type 1
LWFHGVVPRTDEIFDVVDAADRAIGRAARADVHARNLRHRAVHVLLFNGNGEIYIQKRAASKDTFPGRYDSSASGHLGAGETYDACAAREVREELGLIVPPSGFQKQFKIEAREQTGWEFVWTYSVRSNEPPAPDPHEIESGAFWSADQVRARLGARPEQFAPSFKLVFEEFDRRGLLPNG